MPGPFEVVRELARVGFVPVYAASTDPSGAGSPEGALGSGPMLNLAAYVLLHSAPAPSPCQKLICSNTDEGSCCVFHVCEQF